VTICPECGGPDYEARFKEFIALEFDDPAPGAVHLLTVTAYVLRHSTRLSREGRLFEPRLLEDFIEHGADPAQVRRDHRADVDGGRRGFKFKGVDGPLLFTGIHWGCTLRDARQDPPKSYWEDVTLWARQKLLDSQQVILETHGS
jgi:hypothetical protein